jgi:hypothetical protein
MVSTGITETKVTTVINFRALWTVYAFECEFTIETMSSSIRLPPLVQKKASFRNI